ncbi:MAG: 3'(2'),5'-bisphosphate nucleotidase CysQ [Verrucomicrobiota bacterium]
MIKTAIKAAIEAGAAILEIYVQDFEVEFKADESPLTSADKAAHNIIVQALETTPYPVLSEESAEIVYEERKDWKTYWLVDPLDGTKEFIKKNGEFTVNIALIEDGRPVMGVVYAPVLQTLYCGMSAADCGTLDVGSRMTAWKATGCAGKSVDEIIEQATPLSTSNIPRSTTQREAPLRVVASRSHCNEETTAFIEALEDEFGSAERVSRGSSLKLCMVAEGSADIYPRIAPTMEWDTAAAHAVVAAAGGRVVKYDPAIPAVSYLCERWKVGGRKSGESHSTFHIPHSTKALRALRYNKENLLNPFFVVSRL